MGKIMKVPVLGLATLSFVGLCFVSRSWAVTDEEFQVLQKQVQEQNQLLQELQKEHQEDQKEIQQLKQQQGRTEPNTAAVSRVQPVSHVLQEPAGNRNFVLTGDAEVKYVKNGGASRDHGSFVFADFAPVFLFRANDKVLFEGGFDTTLSNDSLALNGQTSDTATGTSGNKTKFDLTFAQIDYLFNDYATLVAGKMLLPLGTYTERSAGWLNKIADDPLPRSLLMGQGVGAQLRGSKSIGDSGSMVTYAVYGTNGGSEVDGTGNATSVDSKGNTINNFDPDGNVVNLNRKPSEGGRIGWFYPWKANYDIELGLSGQTGTWDRAGKELWQAGIIDAAFHFTPYFETKGEYIYTNEKTRDLGTITPQGWWVQSGFKLSAFKWDVPLIPNTELVFRYDTVNHDISSLTGTSKGSRRYTPGIVYYITNTLWLEASYEKILHSSGNPSDNQWLVQLSYGF